MMPIPSELGRVPLSKARNPKLLQMIMADCGRDHTLGGVSGGIE